MKSFREERAVSRYSGYTMIEMLIVCGIILILATLPVALLRRSREKVWEADAVRSLGMMAVAYENYWAQNGHMYPNYRSDAALGDGIDYRSAEQIWDNLIRLSLVPRKYSGFAHDEKDLLARGYVLTIYPADYGAVAGGGPKNTYAIALLPYEGSSAKRGLAILQGRRMGLQSVYPSPIPRKLGQFGIFSTSVYGLPD
jgi:type II secretory pathway pseudopilin PulG